MGLKVYEYANCSTCKKALKFLDAAKIKYEKIGIVARPPDLSELKKMLQHLQADGKTIKNLFNTSGQLYREMNISELIKSGAGENELLKLLSKNGKLIKRPFLLGAKVGSVGYNEESLKKLISLL